MDNICAVLVAAGSGLRFKSDTKPKQFIELKGRPLFIWSLDVFVKHSQIDHIVICTLESKVDEVNSLVKLLYPNKKIDVVAGGLTRQESVRQGLLKLESCMPEYVLVHDAVRPFVTNEIIQSAIDCVTKFGACTAAVPITDTIKVVQEQIVIETLDRNNLRAIQTPQAAKFDWLLAAHRLALTNNRATTDDAALLEGSGHKVAVFPGSPHNIKVTQKEDMVFAELLADLICI